MIFPYYIILLKGNPHMSLNLNPIFLNSAHWNRPRCGLVRRHSKSSRWRSKTFKYLPTKPGICRWKMMHLLEFYGFLWWFIGILWIFVVIYWDLLGFFMVVYEIWEIPCRWSFVGDWLGFDKGVNGKSLGHEIHPRTRPAIHPIHI